MAGVSAAAALAVAALVGADPYPPYWGGGSGIAVHFPPVAWPAAGQWTPYTHAGVPTADAKDNDASNGGTSPQGYVNVSSGCTDRTLPSTYYAYRDGVLFFRWRVQQAPNTYAAGPSPGSFSSSNPWSSALWTVLVDVNGDGYRDFALQLDGSSGGPSAAVDRIASIYSTTRSQSVDYVGDPNVHLLGHNPTAFVDQASGRLLNFQGTLSPTTSWPNGSSETRWDYGTTRASLDTSGGCSEYFIDYQLPLGMLDASAIGGPTVTSSTTMALFFATSNSLTNPMQKDVVLADPFVADGSKPVPFGDSFTPAGGTIPQPVVGSMSAGGCGPTTLTATIADTLTPAMTTSVTSAAFLAYFDANGNGVADDAGSAWSQVAAGSTANAPVGRWTATWNSASLARGQYLVGVKATDQQGHVTYSHLTQPQVNALPGATPQHFANPVPPGLVTARFVNTCGVVPVSVALGADRTTLAVGETATFTVTVANNGGSPLALDALTNVLPEGFTFVGTTGGTLSPSTSPTGGQTGSLNWTFSPAASISADSTGTLVFTATAAAVGASSASASAATSAGVLQSGPVQMTVAAPALTVRLTADRYTVAPGEAVAFTATVENDSPAPATGAVLSLSLPPGASYVSHTAPPGTSASYDAGTRTITWTIGLLPGQSVPALVVNTLVGNPFTGTSPLLATATLDSDQTFPQFASAPVSVALPGTPSFVIQLDAGSAAVAPGSAVPITITYVNTGDNPATGTVVTFPVPAGFTASAIGAGGVLGGGVITWTVGDVGQGVAGTLGFTLTAAATQTDYDPRVMTATLDSAETSPVSDTFSLGIADARACGVDRPLTYFYFRNTTADVGSAGTHRIANTTSVMGDTGSSVTVTLDGAGTRLPVVRFYQDPANANDVVFSGSLSTWVYIDRVNGQGIDVFGTVFDYDPANGAKTSLGTYSQTFGGNVKGKFAFTIPVSGTLQAGHRLLWEFDASSGGNVNLQVQFGGTVTNNYSGGTTYADSQANFCTTAPASPTLDSQASALLVAPGAPLTYTIRFGNAGQTSMQSSVIQHTLPAGVTFLGATLNGSPVAPSGQVGQQLTFGVRSSDTATPGLVSGAHAGTLVISASVSDPFTGTPPTLTATTSLASEQTSTIHDTRAVTLIEPRPPSLGLLKTADTSTLEPGDTITYTIVAVNSGTGPASSVVVSDVLPAGPSFAYVPGSTTLGPIPVEPDPYNPGTGTLTVPVGVLAAGATATVTFQMRMGPGGAPEGITSISNTASVSYAESATPVSSGAATVGVRSTPALALTSVAAPAGPVAPGEEITYTMALTSVGSGTVSSPRLDANISAFARYVEGSLQVDGSPATDATDGDAARVDPASGEVTFVFGSMAVGASHTVQFTVRVEAPLPAGSTTIHGTALASATNAPSVSAETFVAADAAPLLSVTTSAPDAVPFPIAVIAAPVTGATEFTVVSAADLSAGDVIAIGGAYVTVTSVEGNVVRVDAPVSAAAGDAVRPTFEYVIEYANAGNAAAGNVQVSATLPSGVTFVSASDGGVLAGDTVTWTIGTVGADEGGVARVRVAPSASGTYAIAPSLTSDDLGAPVVSPPASTSIGAVQLTKRTLTPAGTVVDGVMTVTYEITVANQHPSQAAEGVTIRDLLPAGFTYLGTTSLTGGTAAASPSPGDEQPAWSGLTVPAGGEVVITFVARVANVAPGTAHNDVAGASDNATVSAFDGLSTAAEDVTFAGPLGTTAVVTTPGTVTDTATSMTVSVADIDLDTDPLVAETMTVTVRNQRTGEVEVITLTETGPATGVFTQALPTVKSPAAGAGNDGSLNIFNGDTITVTHVDLVTSAPGPVTVLATTTITSGSGEPPPGPPTVVSLAPASGAAAGGVTVLITGTGFSLLPATPGVTFGGVAGTGVQVVNDTTISVVTPALPAGTPVDVTVNGVGTLPKAYTPVATAPTPTVVSLAPASGAAAGGVTVLITGTGFSLLPATPGVTFGGVAGTGVQVVNDTTISVVTPALPAGTPVDVTVAGAGTLPKAYTPVAPAPVVTSLSPSSGLAEGGVVVLITGTGFGTFTGPVSVTFGGVPGYSVQVLDDTTIRVITPPLPAGAAVNVVVHHAGAPVGTLPYTPVDRPDSDTQDTDDDGLPDEWELRHGLDPLKPGDEVGDPDGDDKTNLEEFEDGTHPRGTCTRYFSEGVTNTPMATRVSLFNPDLARAVVQVHFMKLDGSEVVHEVELAGLSRSMIDAGALAGLEAAEFGVEIVSSTLIAAEEMVTWDATEYGAHTEQAVAASPTWYFGEGATHPPFDLFYLVLNPNATPATVRVKYLQTPPALPLEQTIVVGPRSRWTIWVDGLLEMSELSTTFVADVPVVVERAMYASGAQWWGAGHRAAGVAQPGHDWFVSEGFTSDTWDTYLLLGNPNPVQAEVDVDYLGESGTLLSRRYTVAPESRLTIYVNAEDGSLAHAPLSIRMHSANGVSFLAERAMWWSSSPGTPWIESHTSGSVIDAGPRWAVAEGAVGGAGQAQTYLLVANMGDAPGSVRVALHFGDGTSAVKDFSVGAHTRLTLNVGYEFPEALGRWFSATVTSTGPSPAPIVVEKSIYWDVNGVWWAAGASAPGVRLP